VPSERTRLENLLRTATCLVLPSRYEPFGIVYAEAGWAGVPSIGTTVGGAADAIGSGGIVVEPQSPKQILKAMLAMCSPATAIRLGAEARSRSQLLSWAAVSRRVATVMGLPAGAGEPDLPRGRPLEARSL
jgi:glycosyltransferase involved in cell wall biosynthesis